MARNYRAEYDKYQGTEQQKKNRAVRNAARAKMAKAGKAKKGDGKDVTCEFCGGHEANVGRAKKCGETISRAVAVGRWSSHENSEGVQCSTRRAEQ